MGNRFSDRFLIPIVALVTSFGVTTHAAELLTIGSEAPSLDIQHWVQNGNGKFQPVTKFESGKVYVVEFWATWCGPCVQSMPHLAQLQNEYAEKGVQIVSISDEDLETVEAFLAREVRGAPPAESETGESQKQTYRQLTSAYCLTTDPDQSSYRDYMEAAAQNGIPTAFIVGKDAHVEWIGHPMEMDGPLQAVVSDRWDRAAFAEEMKARQEAEKAMQDLQVGLQTALQSQDFETALKLIDNFLATNENMQLVMLKLQILMATEKFDAALAYVDELLGKGESPQLKVLKLNALIGAKQLDKANEYLTVLFNQSSNQPNETNMTAWSVYQMAAQGIHNDKNLIASSVQACQSAVEKTDNNEEKASIFDTLSRLLFLQGQLDQAIEAQQQATQLTNNQVDEYVNFLKELLEAKKNAASATEPKAEPGPATRTEQ